MVDKKRKVQDASMPIVISFDPGETTGVLIGQYPTIFRSMHILWPSKIKDKQHLKAHPHEWALVITDILYNWEPNIVVIESFRLYQKTAASMVNNDFIPVQVIGGIKCAVALYNLNRHPDKQARIVMQPPAARTNVKLLDEHKEYLLSSPHAKDAYMHWRLHAIKWMRQHQKGK